MATGTRAEPMPEIDWLTGLSSRAAFGRGVNQADRDRDRFTIALIEIDDLDQINQRLDYETGDDLLRMVGRGLAAHHSVTTTVARLGGARFGILRIDDDRQDPRRWIEPIVATVREAVASWTFGVVDFTGECLIRPRLRVGLAAGHSGLVWNDAALALDLAGGAGCDDTVQLHDESDPRIQARRRRRALTENLERALAEDGLRSVGRPVETVRGPAPSWRWRTLQVERPSTGRTVDGVDDGDPILDRTTLPARIRRRLDRWLVDEAGRTLRHADRQLRLTVPLTGELVGCEALIKELHSAINRWSIPPSRLLFEIDEAALVRDRSPGPGPVDGQVRLLVRELERVDSGVVVAGCTGGWPAWVALEDLPIRYLKPDPDLMRRSAGGDRCADRVLRALAENAASLDRQLIAPPSTASADYLADLGFAYRERAENGEQGGKPHR